MFSLLFGAACNFTALFTTPPNNNEGWPPCGIDDRAACSLSLLFGGPYLHINYFIIVIGIVIKLLNIKVDKERIGLINAMLGPQAKYYIFILCHFDQFGRPRYALHTC
jgi:hypothetical protein